MNLFVLSMIRSYMFLIILMYSFIYFVLSYFFNVVSLFDYRFLYTCLFFLFFNQFPYFFFDLHPLPFLSPFSLVFDPTIFRIHMPFFLLSVDLDFQLFHSIYANNHIYSLCSIRVTSDDRIGLQFSH